jgi:O-antigen/teichoic acid export membrane protein
MKASSFRGISWNKLRLLLASLKKSAFVRNLLIVMSGTALAQVLGYALSPIISRLYSPADFGIFGSFGAALSIIGAVITLDYSQAIMLPKQKDEAWALFLLSCLTSTLIAIFFLLGSLIFPSHILKVINAPQAWILGVLVLGVFLSGLGQACQAWCVRVKAFKATSASQIIRSLTSNGTQAGLGYLKAGAPALISAVILGDLLATLNLAKVVARDLRELNKTVRWRRIWDFAKEYHDFPVYSASTNMINALSQGLPIFLLTHYYGIATAGAYAFGIRILSAPMELVLRALRQVLYQKAAETHNDGRSIFSLYVKFTGGLFALGLVPALIMIIWAPPIFSWIFGAQWHLAGIFARGIIIWLVFMFSNLPATICARIVRMQRQMFLYNLVLLVLRTLALVLGGLYLSSATTVLLFSLVGAGMNVVYILIIGIAIKNQEGAASWNEAFNDLKGTQ